MRLPRVYLARDLIVGECIVLPPESAHYLVHVLRLHSESSLILFNNTGREFQVQLQIKTKSQVMAHILSETAVNCESPLDLTLIQGISKGERMDFVMQKSVELGVSRIIPVMTQRCVLKLPPDRLEKKWEHWQKIIISACEQSGRARVPLLLNPQSLSQVLQTFHQDEEAHACVLSPHAVESFKQFSKTFPNLKKLAILIGPEGGLSEEELQIVVERGFYAVSLGARILRTETAALTALSLAQCLWGDF